MWNFWGVYCLGGVLHGFALCHVNLFGMVLNCKHHRTLAGSWRIFFLPFLEVGRTRFSNGNMKKTMGVWGFEGGRFWCVYFSLPNVVYIPGGVLHWISNSNSHTENQAFHPSNVEDSKHLKRWTKKNESIAINCIFVHGKILRKNDTAVSVKHLSVELEKQSHGNHSETLLPTTPKLPTISKTPSQLPQGKLPNLDLRKKKQNLGDQWDKRVANINLVKGPRSFWNINSPYAPIPSASGFGVSFGSLNSINSSDLDFWQAFLSWIFWSSFWVHEVMCVAKIRGNTLMFQMDMVDLTLILWGHQLECIGPSFWETPISY